MFDAEADGCYMPDTPLPNGYGLDTASLTDLQAGEELLFSVPKTYLDPGLAIRVDFRFNWERNERYTRYSTYFSYWHLPENLRDREKEKKLKQRCGAGLVGGPAEYYRSPLPTDLKLSAPSASPKKR